MNEFEGFRGMEKNGEGFHGMSSVNEYWKRVNKCELPDFESSSSDDESNESKSSCREYKDASCNVDLDQEFEDESIDGIVVTAKSSTNDLTLIETIDEDIEIKSSRYVRWDVLLSLGIGLWAVLCIVDFLHSEKSGARGKIPIRRCIEIFFLSHLLSLHKIN